MVSWGSLAHAFRGHLMRIWCGLFFEKFRVSSRVRVKESVSRCKNIHFWCTIRCQKVGNGWNSVWRKFGPQSARVEKVDFSKIRVSVRVRVSFSRCENVHFWWTRWCPHLGRGEKVLLENVTEVPKCWKSGLLQKLGPVSVRVSFWRCENVHFWWTQMMSKIWEGGEKSAFEESLVPKCGKVDFFKS